jgi:hypothetical protein
MIEFKVELERRIVEDQRDSAREVKEFLTNL